MRRPGAAKEPGLLPVLPGSADTVEETEDLQYISDTSLTPSIEENSGFRRQISPEGAPPRLGGQIQEAPALLEDKPVEKSSSEISLQSLPGGGGSNIRGSNNSVHSHAGGGSRPLSRPPRGAAPAQRHSFLNVPGVQAQVHQRKDQRQAGSRTPSKTGSNLSFQALLQQLQEVYDRDVSEVRRDVSEVRRERHRPQAGALRASGVQAQTSGPARSSLASARSSLASRSSQGGSGAIETDAASFPRKSVNFSGRQQVSFMGGHSPSAPGGASRPSQGGGLAVKDDKKRVTLIDIQIPEDAPTDLEHASKKQMSAALAADIDNYERISEKRRINHFNLQMYWTNADLEDGEGLFRGRSTFIRNTEHGYVRFPTQKANRHNALISRAKTALNLDDVTGIHGGALSAMVTVSPFSSQRLYWDVCTAFLLIFDLLAIPFMVGFNPQRTPLLLGTEVISLAFWGLDIFASFLTGYPDRKTNAKVVLNLNLIAKRYIKTWFLLDCALVSLDGYLVMGDGGNGAMIRSMRTLRVARSLRLIRLLKLRRIVNEWYANLHSQMAAVTFRIVLVMCGLIVLTHHVACMWYLIGASQGPDASSWVNENDLDGTSLAYQYAISLHWSITQTHGTMEVTPGHGSVAERYFSVLVVLLAMVTFISFVSIVTNALSELTALASNHAQEFWLLRKYFHDWNVPRDVSRRIQRYLEFAYNQRKRRIQFQDVKLLNMLSAPLLSELVDRTITTHLRNHAFFESCGRRALCFSGSLSHVIYARGDALFTAGGGSPMVCHVCSGELQYTLGQLPDDEDERRTASFMSASSAGAWNSESFNDAEPDTVTMVECGDFVCEPALWVDWVHLGDLHCATEVQVVNINVAEFGKSIWQDRALWLPVRSYAEQFALALNEYPSHSLTDLTYTMFDAQYIVDRSEMSGDVVKRAMSTTHSEASQFAVRMGSRLAGSRIGSRLVSAIKTFRPSTASVVSKQATDRSVSAIPSERG